MAISDNRQNEFLARHTTNELSWRNLYVKLTGEVDTSFSFSLSSAIRQEDIRATSCQHRSLGGRDVYSHFNSVLVLAIQQFHGFNGFWDWPAAPDEHTIDIESKGKSVCAWDFWWSADGRARRLGR